MGCLDTQKMPHEVDKITLAKSVNWSQKLYIYLCVGSFTQLLDLIFHMNAKIYSQPPCYKDLFQL